MDLHFRQVLAQKISRSLSTLIPGKLSLGRTPALWFQSVLKGHVKPGPPPTQFSEKPPVHETAISCTSLLYTNRARSLRMIFNLSKSLAGVFGLKKSLKAHRLDI